MLEDHWDHLNDESHYVHLALWTATPGSLGLARRSLEAGDPKAILQFITMHYNLYSSSQPPTAELRRLVALEPWLSFVDDAAFRQLEEHCNRQGWHVWRRAHIDARLEPADHASWRTGESRRNAFDKAADEGRSSRPVHWDFEHMASSVGDPQVLLDEVEAWLYGRRDPAALKTACAFVIEANSRAELPRLVAWRTLEIDGADAVIDDAIFAIKRRTLS